MAGRRGWNLNNSSLTNATNVCYQEREVGNKLISNSLKSTTWISIEINTFLPIIKEINRLTFDTWSIENDLSDISLLSNDIQRNVTLSFNEIHCCKFLDKFPNKQRAIPRTKIWLSSLLLLFRITPWSGAFYSLHILRNEAARRSGRAV